MENSIVWLLIGAAFLALEAFGLAGVGLLFGGLAALSVALLIKAGMLLEPDFFLQSVWFMTLTVLWAAILWRPIRNWYRSRTEAKDEPVSIIGTTAIVDFGGVTREKGHVMWSGTQMLACLAEEEPADRLPEGTTTQVVRVKGNTLYVKRRGG